MIEIEQIKSRIASLATKHGLRLVILFGSQVTGKTHAHSDTDIGVLPSSTLTLRELAELQLTLTSIFKRPDVEITDLKSASPLLLKEVAVSSISLYESEKNLFDQFRIYCFKRHMEDKGILTLRERALDKYLQTV